MRRKGSSRSSAKTPPDRPREKSSEPSTSEYGRARRKVVSLTALAGKVRTAQKAGRVVALCHGCFDILHAGHLRHLEAARRLADVLIVTVTPDRFVNKGTNRPVFPARLRAELLAGLEVTTWVAVNRWDSAVETLKRVRPNLFVKGQEYETNPTGVNPNFLLEAKAIQSVGGRIVFTQEYTSSSTDAFKRLTALSSPRQEDRDDR